MALTSDFFTKAITDPAVSNRLKACSEINVRHIFQNQADEPGLKGAVSRIQDALRIADSTITITDPDGVFGPSTADAVFKFKSGHKPRPILGPGQTIPDRIVGIQTIAALDAAMGAQPKPGPAGLFQDVVIRIMGFGPDLAGAGTRTTPEQEKNGTDGQARVHVPSVRDLKALINTDDYLQLHQKVIVINFNGGGGAGNPATDPTAAIVAALKDERGKAVSGGAEPGKVIIYGWSSGGRCAATVAQAIHADPGLTLTVDYIGMIDAAWDNQNDPVRTAGVNAFIADSVYQSASNILLSMKNSGISEFHGPVPNTNDIDLNAPHTLIRAKQEAFQLETRIRPKHESLAFFNDVHKDAVDIGHHRVQRKILGLLGSV